MLFEHFGDNRTWKSGGMATEAWRAFNKGVCPTCNRRYWIPLLPFVPTFRCPFCNQAVERIVIYCNCPIDELGEYHHILNFPHKHISPSEFWDYRKNLFNTFIMTDEGITNEGMDSRKIDQAVLETSYFGYQATKIGCDWHFDTVRHKNLGNRVRLNAHWYIHSFRYPPDPRQALKAVRLVFTARDSPYTKTRYILHPERFFPLWNSVVVVTPKRERILPPVEQVHRLMVSP